MNSKKNQLLPGIYPLDLYILYSEIHEITVLGSFSWQAVPTSHKVDWCANSKEL